MRERRKGLLSEEKGECVKRDALKGEFLIAPFRPCQLKSRERWNLLEQSS
ncbi:CD47 antigen (Rh-related antigen, integrin-associated signal transducer), isoform CRA_d [Rattus norvegicus]|uniref:CD47 antigen (Rh-related antigen, integrin-associated signal transducer), isoform CRA_d n=1 Tax=Rattus norvegicus TaxID=10116 RepID=A6IQU1_RAT|nr:CD47 antigen (Rh-related antigen, integrin-associated signal transducer), isoform CRA_d [Rattus norvegicus]